MNVHDPSQNNQGKQVKHNDPPKQSEQQIDYVNSYQPPADNNQADTNEQPSQKKTSEKENRPDESGQDEPSQIDHSQELKKQKNNSAAVRRPAGLKPKQREDVSENSKPASKPGSNITPPPKKTQTKDNSGQPASSQEESDQDNQPASNNIEAQAGAESEKLVDQNIFVLLGVTDGLKREKESFLEELQQVIWEDFLENDLELLVTSQEKQKIDQILANDELNDLQKQEEIIVFLDELIPDLEEILMEKALELKQELVQERVQSMRDLYAHDEEKNQQIQQAAQLFSQNKWRSGAEILNQISANH